MKSVDLFMHYIRANHLTFIDLCGYDKSTFTMKQDDSKSYVYHFKGGF